MKDGGQWVTTGMKDKQATPAPDEAKRPTKRAPTTVANSSLLIYGNSRALQSVERRVD